MDNTNTTNHNKYNLSSRLASPFKKLSRTPTTINSNTNNSNQNTPPSTKKLNSKSKTNLNSETVEPVVEGRAKSFVSKHLMIQRRKTIHDIINLDIINNLLSSNSSTNSSSTNDTKLNSNNNNINNNKKIIDNKNVTSIKNSNNSPTSISASPFYSVSSSSLYYTVQSPSTSSVNSISNLKSQYSNVINRELLKQANVQFINVLT